MRKLLLAALLLVALVSSSVSSVPAAAASPLANVADTDIAAMLAAHNAVRQRVAAAESQRLGGTVSIPDLTWNSDLAAYAQDWADYLLSSDPVPVPDPRDPTKVIYKFPHHDRDDLNARGWGENIYAGWGDGAAPASAPSVAVTWWDSEEAFYNYDANTCALGLYGCGHYTQLVWSATTQVGCGQATRIAASGTQFVVWVCNYGPAGNINIEVQRPYTVTPAAPVTPPPGCVTYNWTRDLQLGTSGPDVVALQMWLAAAGETVYQTGGFDSVTDAAVRHFQAVRGLVVDGIVGPQTQAALNHVCPKFKRLGRHRH